MQVRSLSVIDYVPLTVGKALTENTKRSGCKFGTCLDAFAKLRKPSIGFIMSVRPSVRIEKFGS
jgi:hypothetical protein